MSAARPPSTLLRRPGQQWLRKQVIIATGISLIGAFAYKVFIFDWRRNGFKNFYATWDNERHMKRMEDSGVFQSARPSEAPEWVKDYETEVDQAINALKSN